MCPPVPPRCDGDHIFRTIQSNDCVSAFPKSRAVGCASERRVVLRAVSNIILGSFARGASGHAAAPPSSDMNSRRFIALTYLLLSDGEFEVPIQTVLESIRNEMRAGVSLINP
jgi:hypothetical protein